MSFETKIGAEARIEITRWESKAAIRKIRIPKHYRNEELDLALRSKRTRSEVEAIHMAKLAGVDAPQIYMADPDRAEIIMEFVEGVPLKHMAQSDSHYRTLGAYAARLHKVGLIHGDLTTKNAIGSNGRLALIDFGLAFSSNRIEDRAEDLHLLKQVLKTVSNTVSANRKFGLVMLGYESVSGNTICEKIQNQIAQIELRGRYARVD
ncbi:MAG: Kae1-associated serine/threonine protein kinase [Nitrososphaerota archaeon]|nr:Kae1-associated serine/threonine protein kinase [Nitrososphaerota archaeon]